MKREGSAVWGVVLVVLGFALLAETIGGPGLRLAFLWPFLLMAWGLGIVIDALLGTARARGGVADPDRDRGGRRGSLFAWVAALVAVATAWAWAITLTAISAFSVHRLPPVVITVARALGRVVAVLAPHALPLLPAVALAGIMLVLAAAWTVSWKGRVPNV